MRSFAVRFIFLCLTVVLAACHSMPTARDAPATPTERHQVAVRKLKKAGNAEDRWLALGEAAKSAAWIGRNDEAGKYAEELRALTPGYRGTWNYGNAVHDYNTVFGLIALDSGDKRGAKRFLFASGRTPGSPQLNSLGPNMSLAKALLISGERSTVITYFDLCRRFWPGDNLSAWQEIVRSGGVPDFGGNLVY